MMLTETAIVVLEQERPDMSIPAETAARVLDCPFCGTRPEIMTSGEGSRGLMIHCIAENCPNPSTSYYDHEATLAVWNQRGGMRRATLTK